MVTKPKVNITTAAAATTTSNGGSSAGIATNGDAYSYQNSNTPTAAATNSRSNNPYETPPTIHQYHTEEDNGTTSSYSYLFRSTSSSSSMIGDTSLLPNIGRTNRYADHALFGLAYHELMIRLQISISVNALFVLVILFLTWYMQLFQPIHLVLSAILAILAFVLLMVEGKMVLNNIFASSSSPTTTANTTTAVTSSSTSASSVNNTTASNQNTHTIHVIMKQLERVGTIILYHPMGKTSYLLVCSLLCFTITGIIMFLFGIVFLCNALTLIYCYVTYPECRQSFQTPSNNNNNNTDEDNNNVSRSWSSYYSDIANTATVSSWVGERASLLRT